jgi:hypothetical protein
MIEIGNFKKFLSSCTIFLALTSYIVVFAFTLRSVQWRFWHDLSQNNDDEAMKRDDEAFNVSSFHRFNFLEALTASSLRLLLFFLRFIGVAF